MTWATVPIGTVILSSQYGLSLPADPDGDVPIVGMKDIQDGRVRIDPNVCVNLSAEEAQNYLLADGDILLNRTNSPDLVGKTGIYRGDAKAVFASYLVRLVLDRERVDPDYLIQILASEGGQRHIKQLATRAVSQANLNPTTFKNHFYIPLPVLGEQIGIREVLLTWDVAIKKTAQLIAAKEDAFAALIDRLVLKPASAKVWKTQKLRNIATRVQRRSDGGDHPVLTISNASGFVLQEEKYERYMAGESVKDYTLLRRGEFAYNKGNSLRFQFGCIYQLNTYDEALVPHVYVCFRLHDDINSSYLRHLFAVDYLKPQLGKLVKTGVRNNGLLNIRPDEFLGVNVPIPPTEQQLRIAKILDAARSEIDLLKRQADTYRTQKRGLMQKLLTGQWRVDVSTARE